MARRLVKTVELDLRGLATAVVDKLEDNEHWTTSEKVRAVELLLQRELEDYRTED